MRNLCCESASKVAQERRAPAHTATPAACAAIPDHAPSGRPNPFLTPFPDRESSKFTFTLAGGNPIFIVGRVLGQLGNDYREGFVVLVAQIVKRCSAKM
jgi:hypothetical protein